MTQPSEKLLSTCAFSGHRVIRAEDRGTLGPLLMRAISYAYARGVRTFYTGGALGFDTMAAREVLRFRAAHVGVRLVLLLPCPDQHLRWSPAQRRVYEDILSMADEVIYTADSYVEGCLRQRNFSLALAGDMLVCYVGRTGSGSAQTRRMAESLGKEVYNLYGAR